MPSGIPPSQFHVLPYANVGAGEPFVARVMIGLLEILGAAPYREVEKGKIRDSITGLGTECLIPAFISLRELRQTANRPDVPVLNKTKNFDDVYKYLWTAYKDRTQTTARLMGYDIGFLFQKDSKFEEGCAAFPKANPDVSSELIRVMKIYRSTWQPELLRFRNDYLEHQTISREAVAEFYSLEKAERMFASVWIAIEEILVLLIAAKLSLGITIRELSKSEQVTGIPKRFGFAWENQLPPK